MQILVVSGLRGAADRLIPRAPTLYVIIILIRGAPPPRGYHTRGVRARVRVIATSIAKDEGHVILLCRRRDSWTSAVGVGKRGKKAAAGEQSR